MLLPTIAHDLELSRDGLQLARGGVAYFNCELFHISFIVSAGPELPPRTGVRFGKFSERKIIKRALNCILYHPRAAVKLVARLLLALFYFFLFFNPVSGIQAHCWMLADFRYFNRCVFHNFFLAKRLI